MKNMVDSNWQEAVQILTGEEPDDGARRAGGVWEAVVVREEGVLDESGISDEPKL